MLDAHADTCTPAHTQAECLEYKLGFYTQLACMQHEVFGFAASIQDQLLFEIGFHMQHCGTLSLFLDLLRCLVTGHQLQLCLSQLLFCSWTCGTQQEAKSFEH